MWCTELQNNKPSVGFHFSGPCEKEEGQVSNWQAKNAENPGFPESKTLTWPSVSPPENSSVGLPPAVTPVIPFQVCKLH